MPKRYAVFATALAGALTFAIAPPATAAPIVSSSNPNLGTQRVGGRNGPIPWHLTNEDNTTSVTTYSASIDGGDRDDFRIVGGTCTNPGRLAPHASCDIAVDFAPKTAGNKS